jgi:hypothetical protein
MDMYLRILATLIPLVVSTSAYAQWQATVVEDAFDGDQHMALVADYGGYGVGFRCTDRYDLTLFYGTPETVTENLPEISNLSTLAVIVDSAEPITLTTSADQWGEDKLRFISSDARVQEIAFDAIEAQKRFAITAKILGKNFHSRVFTANGSGKAIKSVLKKCGIILTADSPPKADDPKIEKKP